MLDLKPCPFCGDTEYSIRKIQPFLRGTVDWAVGCEYCHVSCICRTLEEAIEKWNRRVESDE